MKKVRVLFFAILGMAALFPTTSTGAFAGVHARNGIATVRSYPEIKIYNYLSGSEVSVTGAEGCTSAKVYIGGSLYTTFPLVGGAGSAELPQDDNEYSISSQIIGKVLYIYLTVG